MKTILLTILAFTFLSSFSQELIPQFNKTVTFLYAAGTKELSPQGTGFLVSIPAKNQPGHYVYLVTAKHVLLTAEKKPLNIIFARLNTKDSSEMFRVPLNWSGSNQTVFVHSDPSVDLALIPVVVPNHLEFKHIGVDQILKRTDYDSLKINAGTEVFFSGLFTAYIGTKHINPIFRFGKVCLIPEEKIEFDGIERELLLIESSSFGGNSGSPVIFHYQFGNTTRVNLAGVILGSFNQGQVLGKTNEQNVIAWSSLGITAVTPSDFISDILNSPELANRRTK